MHGVYYLTTTTRCERLAVQLTGSVLYEPLDPPSPPPAQPVVESPPPPSLPPSPNMPAGISETPIASVYLSTLRLPTLETRRRLSLYDDGFHMTASQLNTSMAALATADQGHIASCTSWQTTAILPCVSDAFENNCISGKGTVAHQENSAPPFVECGFQELKDSPESPLGL